MKMGNTLAEENTPALQQMLGEVYEKMGDVTLGHPKPKGYANA